jgi:hypothetical protein
LDRFLWNTYKNAPLNPSDEATFYASGPKGFTDYPTLS